ncbi:MAG TPA: aldo/keto reductase [bacterium]|nr:aldo/keto reductase [bacterium]HOL34414.1 aldo/keto reductase [bacterium]HPP08669.1 aldo/keto reductase [bacterium]
MLKRKLGSSDMEITIIGLGTWAIGGTGYNYSWGSQDDRDSIETIKTAINLGINWVDTAPAYGLGHSEKIVGIATKDFRNHVFIFTKLGKSWDEKGVLGDGLSGKTVRQETLQSMKRLGVGRIDLMQIHWPRPDTEVEPAWTEMCKLVDEGKIRAIGVSNFNIEQLERIKKIRIPASLQPPYCIFRREIEKEILPWCRENNVGVICYSPMYYGLLAEKFDEQRISKMSVDDWRRKLPELSTNHKIYCEFYDQFKKIADQCHMTTGQLAIAWVLAHPAVTGAIVGARKPDQIKEIMSNCTFEISASVKEEIDSLSEQYSTLIRR